mmetsp:Transcript_99937/g.254218  ORF Transcript_99937/g.254218 Transcript_99937/m.254218 type:complete len:339 (-) Transcript_99937:295-1311(-)
MLPSDVPPAPPAEPERSPDDRAAINLSGNIMSTGSVTRRMDSPKNSLRKSAAAANNASRSGARSTGPRARPAWFTLSKASAKAFKTFGHSDTKAFREALSWETRANFAFKLEVASDQKRLVNEVTPSCSSTELKVFCVSGSVFDRTTSSRRCTRCVCAASTCKFISNACWNPDPAGRAAWENSSTISESNRRSWGHMHCKLKNTCSATLRAIWLPCRAPERRSPSACCRMRRPVSRIQVTSALKRSIRSNPPSLSTASSSCSVCAAFDRSLAGVSICVCNFRASNKNSLNLRIRMFTDSMRSSSIVLRLTPRKGDMMSPLIRTMDDFSMSTTSRMSPN